MTRSGHTRIAMLTRFPVAGRVKTRLIPALGPAGAAELHRAMTAHAASELTPLAATGEAVVEIWHEGGTRRSMQAWLGPLPRYRPQPRGDLGDRLVALFRAAFAAGADRALAIGADCPAMRAHHLREACARLGQADVVLGPAADGGYWLVGLSRAAAPRARPLFETIAWGTAAVLAQTQARAAELGLRVASVDTLADVDRPADLAEWERCRDRAGAALRLSVVIPAVDEERGVSAAIRSAWAGGAAEVVLADGGSQDATRARAAAAGAVVVASARGRARQMNAGAARATGDALLFLHADTLLPSRAAERVRAALAEPGVVGGAFSYRAAGGGLLGHVLTTGGRLRCRLSGHPYGDQALYLRARTFRALGGFPELPVMEDWELVHRLRRLGRLVVGPESAITSAESFVEHGLLWSGFVNLGTVVGYRLGLRPLRLARWRSRVARR